MSSENWTLEADTDVIHVLFPANDENENQVAAMMTSPSSGSSSLASASLLSSATPNSSGTSLAAAALAAGGHHEPPTALRQNGDGTEAPAAPPKIPPIFDASSESVPVDGKTGGPSFDFAHFFSQKKNWRRASHFLDSLIDERRPTTRDSIADDDITGLSVLHADMASSTYRLAVAVDDAVKE